jgi:glycosyltransferase involved in cell wall biosynthesis
MGKYRFVVDGQLWQTTAWDRGMGKYAVSLIETYGKAHGSENITIIFNSNLPLDKARREMIERILPGVEITLLDLPGLTGDVEQGKRIARAALKDYLGQNYKDHVIDFLILQLFTFDYCAAFPEGVNKLLLFYDLIPLKYWSVFSKYFGVNLYFAHFRSIYEADTILSISSATKQQLIELLGVNPRRITNLSGAFIARENKSKDDTGLKIPGRYILLNTADYPHKNTLNSVKAFAQFNEVFANSLWMVLTSDISEETKEQLTIYSKNLIFAGKVSDAGLAHLYEHAELLLFASKDEGLGLPVLEGVSYGKPIVCSKIEVFEEISNKAFYMCNPNDSNDIKEALSKAFTGIDWPQKEALYQGIKEDFTWERSAQRLFEQLEKPKQQAVLQEKIPLRIVMSSPALPGAMVAQKIQSAYGFIHDNFDAEFYLAHADDKPLELPEFLEKITVVSDIKRMVLNGGFNGKVVYAIDDSVAASSILMATIASPGIVLVMANSLHEHLQKYVGDDLIAKLFGCKPGNKQIITYLEKVGNEVTVLDAKAGYGWDFGIELKKIIDK